MNTAGVLRPDTDISADGIRRFYTAFSEGDIDGAATMVTQDFLLHVPGKARNSGEYWGREGFRTFASNIRNYTGGIFTLQVNALAVNGDNAFTRERVTLNRRHNPDRKWDLRFVMHYKMRNGLISEAWTIPEDLYAYDQYWTPEYTTTDNDSAVLNPPSGEVTQGEIRSQSNMELLLRLYRSFWDGDFESIRPLMLDDLVLHVVGRRYLSGNYVGFQGWRDFRTKLMGIAGDKYKLEIDAIAASSTDVFVKEYIRMNTAKDPGVVTEYVIMHFQMRDGRIAAINDIPLDLYEWERFFSE